MLLVYAVGLVQGVSQTCTKLTSCAIFCVSSIMCEQQVVGDMADVILKSDLNRLKEGLHDQRWTETDIVKSAFLAARRGVWDCLSVLLDHGFPLDRYTLVLVLVRLACTCTVKSALKGHCYDKSRGLEKNNTHISVRMWDIAA